MKKITKYIAFGSIFLIPLFPLIVANSFFFPFITGKAFYFRILVEIAFMAWVVLAFMDAKYRPRFNALTISVSIFTVIVLLADLLGINPLRSIWSNFERMEGWMVILHLWGFFMVTTNLFSSLEEGKNNWHKWFNVSLIIAFIIGIYGIVQLFGWATIHQGSTRIDASLGNAAYMAVYMLMNAFLAAYMFFFVRGDKSVRNSFLQYLYGFLAIFFSFLIFETATRGTILGLLGGIMLSLALYSIFGKNENRKNRYICGTILAVIIVIGVVFWLNRGASFIQNDQILSRLANISWKETQTQARAYIWPMALKGAMERPILGWGQENFNYIFNTNYEPRMWSQEQWFDRAHSVFLDWLVAGGILGLLSYLSLYVILLIMIWKSNMRFAEKSVFTGLVAAYAIHNIFVFDNLASYLLFFSVLGFASSLKEGKTMTWMGTNPMRTDAVEYIVAPAAIVLLILGIYFMNVRPINANTRLISAISACANSKADATLFEKALSINSYLANQEIREQTLSCGSNVVAGQYTNNTKQAFYTLSTQVIKDQIAATPRDARIYALGGNFYNMVGQYDEAAKLLDVAHQLSPMKQSISFQLATDYINLGKANEAVEVMKQAYESDTTYYEAKAAYVIALVFAGKEVEARKQFGDDKGLFENDRIAQIYVIRNESSKALALYEKLLVADPTNITLKVQLARLQYEAGMITKSIQTMRSIEKDRPDLKAEIDSAIKQIQAGK